MLNIVDYGILLTIIVSVIISLLRGFVKESLSLVTWVAAAFIALNYSSIFADSFSSFVTNDSVRVLLSLVAIFILVLLTGTFINHTLSYIINKTGLSPYDKVFGVCFGLLRAILIISLVVLFLRHTSLVHQSLWRTSMFIPHFSELAKWLASLGFFNPDEVVASSMMIIKERQ